MAGIVFGVFCILSVISAVIVGNTAAVGEALFSGAEDAVRLMLSLCGMMCLWSGLLEVLQALGVLYRIERILAPLLSRLFGEQSRQENRTDGGLSEITASLSANLLGIGNAATPIGLRAMAHLRQYREDPEKMSNVEILFVVMNTAPPTLLPTTLLTLRHAAGSADPTAVLPAVWVVSFLGLVFAVVITRALSCCGKHTGRRCGRS